MKKSFILMLMLLASRVVAQDTAIFIRAGFSIASGHFVQNVQGRIILADSKRNNVIVDNAEFRYDGTTTGVVGMFGYQRNRLYLMAGVKNFVLTPDRADANFEIDNLGISDPISYGLGTVRVEYDLLEHRLFYLSPMIGLNYIFTYDGNRDYFEDGKRDINYSAGITAGVEVKRFKFFVTPLINKVGVSKSIFFDTFRDEGIELGIFVNLLSLEK